MKKYLSLFCLMAVTLFGMERPPECDVTPPAQPTVQNGAAEPFFFADFIYWKVWQGGMELARTGFQTPVNGKGKVFEPDFQGEVGFRVGVGVNLAQDGWDLGLKFTWMRSSVEESVSRAVPVEFLWPFEGSYGPFNQARGSWDIGMNVMDLEWGRHYYISRFLTLRPFFGLKGFWSDQEYRLRYEEHRVHLGQENWGIGIRIGLDTSWYFAKNWDFFGNMALSSAWTHFDERRKDRLDGAVVLHSTFDHYGMTPILELAAGLRWEVWFCEDRCHVAVQVGWEEQFWGDFNRLLKVDQVGALGNLDFQGLTLRFRLDL